MKWLEFILLTSSVLGSAKKPNIVFLLIDDLGFNDVSWHNPSVIMPNLDRLANNATHLKISDFLMVNFLASAKNRHATTSGKNPA